MKLKGVSFILILCFACIALFSGQREAGPVSTLKMNSVGGSAPLHFIANAGQADAEALYCARTPGYTLWLSRDGLVFDESGAVRSTGGNRTVTRLVFQDARRDVRVAASDPSDYRVSYFYGSNESGWKTGIPTSRAVLYEDLYDGIDLKVYGSEGRIEYDWILAPGARPDRIRFVYSGAKDLRLDQDGNLAVETAAGRIVHRRPRAYQVVDGRKTDVEASFLQRADGSCGFAVGSYDPRYELTIDPLVLVYSSYLGGWKEDYFYEIATDPTGALYVSGITRSSDFPPGPESPGRVDIFVSKISPDGKDLIYTAFFPTTGNSGPSYQGIFVDSHGFVYLAGTTDSNKFPVKNAFQSKYGGEDDGFILKISKDGQSLIYSSYIGGKADDWCGAVSVDASGAAYIGGSTFSSDFPTKKAFQPVFGGGRKDGFVAKVAPQGSSLVYSTFFGGSNIDSLQAVIIDDDGAVFLAGGTYSPNFPRKAAFQKALGGKIDAYVAKLSAAGNSLIYSSYLGGKGDEYFGNLATDESGAVYVTGYTNGSFPLKNAFQKTKKGGKEGFVTKIDPQGKAIVYSSYLGGAGDEYCNGIAVDGNGAAYIVGSTESAKFPLKLPYQSILKGRSDAFLAVVDPGGAKLNYSTYLGGKYMENGYGIAIGADGALYLSGNTNSPDFPLLGAYQEELAGDYDGFVLKFSLGDK